MKYLLLFLFLFCSTCCPVDGGVICSQGKSNQCLAEKLIWYEGLGMTQDPPLVKWVENGTVCPFTKNEVGIYHEGKCRTGWFSECWSIELYWWDTKISDTVFVHEYIHAYLYLTLGDLDQEHKRPEWTDLYDQLQNKLIEAGI